MKSMSRRLVLLAAGAAAVPGAAALMPTAPRRAEIPAGLGGDAFRLMYTDPRFLTWASMVELAGLSRDTGEGKLYTVFALTEAAFDRYPQRRRELVPMRSDVTADPERLARIVHAHMLDGLHPVSELRGRLSRFRSVAGTPLVVDGTDPRGPVREAWRDADGVKGAAPLTEPPIEAGNALIYLLDDVTLG